MSVVGSGVRKQVLGIGAACLAGASLASCPAVVSAQSIMRTPNIRVETRVPTITPRVTPQINANGLRAIAPNALQSVRTGNFGGNPNAGRGADVTDEPATATKSGKGSRTKRTPKIDTASRGGRGTVTGDRTPPPKTPTGIAVVLPTIPYVRYAPNTYPSCKAASGGMVCSDRPAFVADLAGGSIGSGGPPPVGQNGAPRRSGAQAGLSPRYVVNQIVAELDAALTDAQLAALAQRYRLALIGSQEFPLIGSRMTLFRITDGRPVDTVRQQMAGDGSVRSTQPNFRYVLQDQATTPAIAEGDPAQYAVAKLRLPQAHALSHGNNVTVAVIDSGIDVDHPELADTIAGSFDALGSKETAHVHGTGIAGAIVAHARLIGSAPSARILAIRAFGVAQAGAESTSFVILKSLDYAASHGAQVINMSFAGPKDALVERGIAAAAAKGIVLVAASGNAGPKSAPLYPAANPGVIAVSATDAYDRLFPASNRGGHIAVAAPGVDVFLPAPGGKYQMTSGTSFSAAYVSGLAALMLARDPSLKPDGVRGILMRTARDLGEPGRDDLFGAGEADAYGAVAAVAAAQVPMANAGDKTVGTPAAPSDHDNASSPPETPSLAADRPAAQ